jgi:hypothetical protein
LSALLYLQLDFYSQGQAPAPTPRQNDSMA